MHLFFHRYLYSRRFCHVGVCLIIKLLHNHTGGKCVSLKRGGSFKNSLMVSPDKILFSLMYTKLLGNYTLQFDYNPTQKQMVSWYNQFNKFIFERDKLNRINRIIESSIQFLVFIKIKKQFAKSSDSVDGTCVDQILIKSQSISAYWQCFAF